MGFHSQAGPNRFAKLKLFRKIIEKTSIGVSELRASGGDCGKMAGHEEGYDHFKREGGELWRPEMNARNCSQKSILNRFEPYGVIKGPMISRFGVA